MIIILGPGITGRGPDIKSRGPDIFISGPRPYSQRTSLGPDIKSRWPDIISQGPNLVSGGPNIINSGPPTWISFVHFISSHTIHNMINGTIRSQQSHNFSIGLYTSHIYRVCMTCSMNIARNTKTGVTVKCLYRILLWKRRHPVLYWFMIEADTKTVLLLYWIALHDTTGPVVSWSAIQYNNWPVYTKRYQPRTVLVSLCTGKLEHIWNTYCFTASSQTNIYLCWLVLFELLKCLSKMERTKATVIFLFSFCLHVLWSRL